MDEIILIIMSSIGVVPSLIVASIVLFIWAAIKHGKQVNWLIRKIFKIKSRFFPKDILRAKIHYWLDFKIKHLHIEELGRKLIFQDLISVYLRSIDDELFELDDTQNLDGLSNTKLYEVFLSCINTVNEKCVTNALDMGIPKVVIDKFNQWHRPTLEFTLKSAELISNSESYNSNEDKIQAMYSICTACIEVTIAEAERTITDLNGDLSGMVYKGVTCD